MMFRTRISLAALACLLAALAGAASAQPKPAEPIAGKTIVLKVPSRLLGYERVSTWSGDVSYGAVIERATDGGLMVGGLNEWGTAGWPLMRQLTVGKTVNEKSMTIVELNDPLYKVKIRFERSIADINAAMREIAFFGTLAEFETSPYYQTEVIDKLLPKIYTGKLASIPQSRKLELLKDLRYVDGAITAEKYKSETYLSINVGTDVEVYNSLRVEQSQRIGHALNKRVLSYFKQIGRTVKFHSDVDGIKISIQIPYKNFVTEAYQQPAYESCEVYASMDLIRQFVDHEITNQEFLEESILLVNGNRTRIPVLDTL